MSTLESHKSLHLAELIDTDEAREEKYFKRIPEKVLNHQVWLNTEFDDKSALIDLYNLAFDSFEGDYSYTTPRGIRMIFYAGEVCHSLETLAKRWGWSKKKVKKYLEDFEKFGIVKIRKTHPGMVITLLDYVLKEKKKPKKKSEVDEGYRWDYPDAF